MSHIRCQKHTGKVKINTIQAELHVEKEVEKMNRKLFNHV